MKKLLAILIAGMMLLSLAACKGANNNNVSDDTTDRTNERNTDVSTGAGVDLKYDFTHVNDKIYHEYTVAFPADGTAPATYYLERPVEKSRVAMFLAQPRVETLEDLLMEVGFHGEWIDALTNRAKALAAIDGRESSR